MRAFFIGGPFDGWECEAAASQEPGGVTSLPISPCILRLLVHEHPGDPLPVVAMATYQFCRTERGLRYQFLQTRLADPIEIGQWTSWQERALARWQDIEWPQP